MPFVYRQALFLDNTRKVGSKECVALIQHFLPVVGPTVLWRAGALVLGNSNLTPGTAIATFVNGRYPNLRHGNHAAFFVAQGANGFWVIDQWRDDERKPLVSRRFIRAKGSQHLANGAWPDGGDNAHAYSVIER